MLKVFSSMVQPSSSSTSLLEFVLLCVSSPTHYLLLLLSGRLVAASTLPGNVSVPAILVFGDSIVDHGNNNNIKTITKCNFPPYGKDFPGGIPTGRFTNAKTAADYLAGDFGIKEFLPAYLDPNLQDKDLPTGVNFASGGAGFDPLTSHLASCFSMTDQLEMFKDYTAKLKAIVGEDVTKYILENSVSVVITGANDITNTYFGDRIRMLHYDINSYTDLLTQFASDFLKELYDLGARRIAVQGIPPLGCVPSQRTLAGGISRKCVENYNDASKLLNIKLESATKSFQSSLSDKKARVFYVDIFYPFLDIIVNHTKYGFTVTDKGCCGTGIIEVLELCNKFTKTCPDNSLYIFWDSFHPTDRGYKVLTEKIFPTYIENLQIPS